MEFYFLENGALFVKVANQDAALSSHLDRICEEGVNGVLLDCVSDGGLVGITLHAITQMI